MATGGDDLIFFNGFVGQLTTTIVNPYSGQSIFIDEQKNISQGVYNGLGGIDTLLMTNLGDALFVRDGMGNQVVSNTEVFLAGDGGDIIVLADGVINLNDTIIFGGANGDIIWANSGADFVSGASGDDVIDGGPGNDELLGEDDDDDISGGQGDDVLNGGAGNDVLKGGGGADNYFAGLNNDVISDAEDGEIDVITLPGGITLADVTFNAAGDDLTITVGSLGQIIIEGQFLTPLGGVDKLSFSNGAEFDLRSIPAPNENPLAADDNIIVDEDMSVSGNVLADNGSGADEDGDGDTLSVVPGAFATAHGLVTLLANGDFTYTPDANYFGADDFTYTLLDGQGGSDTGAVSILVNSINDDPLAQDDDFTGDEDTVISGNVLADNGHGADADPDNGILSVVAGVFATAHGSVSIAANGAFSYTPTLNFSGMDSFSYALLDGQGGSDTGTVNLTVNAAAINVIMGTSGNDHLIGTDQSDKIFGLGGDDKIQGGDDDDIIYGDGATPVPAMDKIFIDSETFPGVLETVSIHDLIPPGDPAVGIRDGNLEIDRAASMTLTVQNGMAGYDSSLGMFAIGANGVIENASILWGNVKTAGVGAAHQIDLPVGEDGGQFGFFIIANGNNANNGYKHLDITQAGNIHFIYDYGLATERAATINDLGTRVKAVYDDGITEKLLSGYNYFTTDRGESSSINWDGKAHVISGLLSEENTDTLRIGFEDLPMLGDADYQDVLFDININPLYKDGNDNLYGGDGDDIFFIGGGADKVHGGGGSDLIAYNAIDGLVDEIFAFQTGDGGDAINLTDILEGYDPMHDAVSDFVRLGVYEGKTSIEVNADGNAGGAFTAILKFNGAMNESIQSLLDHGNLVVNQSVVV